MLGGLPLTLIAAGICGFIAWLRAPGTDPRAPELLSIGVSCLAFGALLTFLLGWFLWRQRRS